MTKKIISLFALSALAGAAGFFVGLDAKQTIILFIFSISILATLFFWDARISFVFIGSGLLLILNAIALEDFLKFASLDVILFLIGMMIIVGMMKDAGFFNWFVTTILRLKNLTGVKLFIYISVASAVLSALMGEVTSIMIMANAIFDIAAFLEVPATPLIITSVMATNTGSAATLIGNPVGILIAARSKLSFEDFLINALPVSFLVLVAVIAVMLWWYRNYVRLLDEKLSISTRGNDSFLYLISVPPDKKTRISMWIFAATILLMSFHRRLETLFGISENTLLMMLPVISAGVVMIYRHDKARHYIEHEVEWQSVLFFMFLFAQAGVIQSSGIAGIIAQKMLSLVKSPGALAGGILFTSGALSSVLDNTVVVASYIPVIKSMNFMDGGILWWALLFGACFGGNITMIGSSANIVALGLLEKKSNIKITSYEWLKIGLIVGIFSTGIALAVMLLTFSHHF